MLIGALTKGAFEFIRVALCANIGTYLKGRLGKLVHLLMPKRVLALIRAAVLANWGACANQDHSVFL